ncbi:amidohydrolase family protein [Psychroflexus maritimus]|uniref:2-amino-3-carboxymuconate-6-semialdehyde decarboxylase n=1 Tax=Psychroflexus maritimus TaxID=2714865 RepID=A0A967DZI6_9FLAO|nr:amidohydrolase family protein [Psychroflexus maritimus]NGZ89542.1 amidohydrolase family protein [Psychroflexus maritimus]
MRRKLRINGHSHLLPYPHQIPDFMREKEIFWVDEDKKFMLQKGWKRPVTDSSFFLNEKLEWMEKYNIDHAVVLNLSQLYGNGLRVEEMKKALRFQNDFNAKVQHDNPKKFTCGFVVHPGFVRGALWEIERCVEDLGMKLLCLPTHYMDSIGTWRCIFDEENEPIFEMANKYNLAVEVHPYDGEKFIKLENTAWRFHLIWMLAQCADAYHFLTLNGYPNKYPNMRVCFAHGGQLAQINLGRRIQGFDGRPDLFEGKVHPRKSVGHKNIFFDTLVHDTRSLKLLLDNQSAKQIITGLDDPYPLGEMESVSQSSYPGKILDLAVDEKIITKEDQDDMWDHNVLQWLFGEDEKEKEKLVNKILS